MATLVSMASEKQFSTTKILSLATTVIAALYILVSLIKSKITQRRFLKFARDNGAATAPIYPSNLFWGLDNMYKTIRRLRQGDDFFDDIIGNRFELMGGWVHQGTSLGNVEIVNIAEPKNMQTILATKFNDFSIGKLRQKQFEVFLGKGIFNAEGAAWSHARSLFRPIFARDNVNDLQDTDRACQILVDALPAGDSGWTSSVDLMPLFYRFTLDTATAFIFGKSVESQTAALNQDSTDDRKEDFVKFSDAFSTIQTYASWRMRLQSFYWLAGGSKLNAAVDLVRRFADRIIVKTLNARTGPDNKHGKPEKYSIVEELTKATQDPLEIRDNVVSLLAAGRDTTSALLSWVFYLLATHPSVYEKLRAIILEDFGEDSSKTLSFSDLKSSRYLQHVISETLRLYPTVPANIRYAVRDTVLPVGGGPDGKQPLAVKKGQIMGMFIYTMQRRPDIWGEDADQFRPERFEEIKRDWSFIPFSGGPRICLGQQYAITEASYLIVRILQTFEDISWEGKAGKPVKGLGLTLWPADGTTVRLKFANRYQKSCVELN